MAKGFYSYFFYFFLLLSSSTGMVIKHFRNSGKGAFVGKLKLSCWTTLCKFLLILWKMRPSLAGTYSFSINSVNFSRITDALKWGIWIEKSFWFDAFLEGQTIILVLKTHMYRMMSPFWCKISFNFGKKSSCLKV